MKKYECGACGYIYDPAKGDPDNGIKPGTAFEDLPDDWKCPLCGMAKSVFEPVEEQFNMSNVIFKFSYGLFILSAKDGDKDGGCIINTAMQATAEPFKASVTVNKLNYTHDMIKKTGKFNVSFLSEDADFDLFKTFGFQSGKDVDKFEGFDGCERADNGIYYVTRGTNAMISVDVEQTFDIGTHTIFVGTVTEEKDLTDKASCTYNYYQNSIKPKPAAKPEDGSENASGDKWVCTICNYIYDPEKGDPEHGIPAGTKFEDIPDDWVCPICKHGKEVFKKLQFLGPRILGQAQNLQDS